MLKKSLFSPAQPRRAETRPFPCGVLASLPGTVKRETSVSLGAAAFHGIRRISARRGWAGEKSGLFEHPVRCSPVVLDERTIEFSPCHNSLFADS
jgi:hypothetical protein